MNIRIRVRKKKPLVSSCSQTELDPEQHRQEYNDNAQSRRNANQHIKCCSTIEYEPAEKQYEREYGYAAKQNSLQYAHHSMPTTTRHYRSQHIPAPDMSKYMPALHYKIENFLESLSNAYGTPQFPPLLVKSLRATVESIGAVIPSAKPYLPTIIQSTRKLEASLAHNRIPQIINRLTNENKILKRQLINSIKHISAIAHQGN